MTFTQRFVQFINTKNYTSTKILINCQLPTIIDILTLKTHEKRTKTELPLGERRDNDYLYCFGKKLY